MVSDRYRLIHDACRWPFSNSNSLFSFLFLSGCFPTSHQNSFNIMRVRGCESVWRTNQCTRALASGRPVKLGKILSYIPGGRLVGRWAIIWAALTICESHEHDQTLIQLVLSSGILHSRAVGAQRTGWQTAGGRVVSLLCPTTAHPYLATCLSRADST